MPSGLNVTGRRNVRLRHTVPSGMTEPPSASRSAATSTFVSRTVSRATSIPPPILTTNQNGARSAARRLTLTAATATAVTNAVVTLCRVRIAAVRETLATAHVTASMKCLQRARTTSTPTLTRSRAAVGSCSASRLNLNPNHPTTSWKM